MKGKGTFQIEKRPRDVSHGYPLLVLDRQGCIHLPLTIFAKAALTQLAASTARTYLYAILPFFEFIEEDIWQHRSGRSWDSAPNEVRVAVDDFLAQRLKCKVRDHRLGFQLVKITAGTRSHIRVFLSALKLFYRFMCRTGRYAYDNPLVDIKSLAGITSIQADIERDGGIMPPRMPEPSGVTEPNHLRRRLSDSFFRLEGEEWIPQIIDDPDFPSLVFRGGDLVGWKLRERCVTSLLFDSGARISEVVGQTLGDWVARGMTVESRAFSKGSGGRRVKFLRFSNATAKLLTRYFNSERRRHDPKGYTIKDYIRLAKPNQIDLYTVPLFITMQGTSLTPKLFRDHYWNPACKAVGLIADVHQTRHWYVTMAIRHIFETSASDAEIVRRKENLIAYMGWRSKETIAAYEHYFSAIRYVEESTNAIATGDRLLKVRLEERRQSFNKQQAIIEAEAPAALKAEQDALDFDYLRKMGGVADER